MKDRIQGKVLIVGGSAQARALAARLPAALMLLPQAGVVAQGWLPGRAGVDLDPVGLQRAGIAAVIEAAHPCDAAIAETVARAARGAGIAHLQLVRPSWRATARDRWVMLQHARQVAAVVPPGARLFATIGRGALPDLKAVRGVVLSRVTGDGTDRGEQAFPLRRGGFVRGAGPFSVAGEMALLRRLRIDWLVLRNAGGPGGWPKLAAARQLGLRVAMLARPRRPGGPRVQTVEEALAWLTHRHLLDG